MITDQLEKFKTLLEWLRSSPFNLTYGEWKYSLEKLETYLFALEKMSPLKIGDEVVLVSDIDVGKGGGWASSAHFLKQGEPAEVTDIDWDTRVNKGEGGWVCYARFHYESTMTEYCLHARRTGIKTRRPYSPDNRHVYFLAQSKFCRISEYEGEVIKNPWESCTCVSNMGMDKNSKCQVEDCKAKGVGMINWHSHGVCPVHPRGDVEELDEWTKKR